ILFAFGYCHAQDRWFQMDMMRRSARGLLSEILGPSALEDDKIQKIKLEEYWANETLKLIESSSDPRLQEMYQNYQMYTEGVNTYLRTHPEKPLEYHLLDADIREWELIDSFSCVKYLSEYFTWGYYDFDAYRIATSLSKADFQELYGFPFPYQIPVTPNYGQYDDIAHPSSARNTLDIKTEFASSPPDYRLSKAINRFMSEIKHFPQEKKRLEWNFGYPGSNNWVISGDKTSTGKPMLATDMHLGWTLPGLWYEAHIVDTSSDLNMYGLSLPGIPFPINGNTRYVGWAHTIALYDLIDWYYYNSINDTHYYYKGQAMKYETMEVSIPVKGKERVNLIINSTVHGPVVTDLIEVEEFSDLVIACKWVAQNITKDYFWIFEAMRAKDVYEFDAANEYFEMLPVNIAFADIHGNIGMRPTAKVPIRNDTGIPEWHLGGGKMPYNGSAGEGEWIGYLPFENLPHSINPAQGYLVSANQVIAGPDYPNVSVINMAGTDEGYRARRLNYLLTTNNQITVEDMINFQLDVYSVRAGNFTPYFLSALDSISFRTSLQHAAIQELQDWDFIMDKDEVAPTIFNIWFEAYHTATFQDEMDHYGLTRYPSWAVLEKLTKEDGNSKWFDNITTSITETRDEIIVLAFRNAINALERYFGTNISDWKWGDIHQYSFTHFSGIDALSKGPFPGDGTGVTVSPSGTINYVNGEVRSKSAGGGASERILIDFSNFNHSLSVIPSGQRGISTSRHYTDQLEQLFLVGEYHKQYYNADTPVKFRVWTQIESTIIFKSGGS
ncbi:MAG: penicillin acylase family protein, partial [Candidatus Hodarchaeota archaeon]